MGEESRVLMGPRVKNWVREDPNQRRERWKRKGETSLLVSLTREEKRRAGLACTSCSRFRELSQGRGRNTSSRAEEKRLGKLFSSNAGLVVLSTKST